MYFFKCLNLTKLLWPKWKKHISIGNVKLKQSVISGGILQRPEAPNFTKFHSVFLELLHLDGRTERRKEQKYRFLFFIPELPQTVAQWTYIAADCCSQTDTVPVMFTILLCSTFTVQILYKLYSLQLNCTYSNYTQAAATCSAVGEERKSPADVFRSVAGYVILYVHICGH